jgi:tight adherence protein B
MAFSRRLLEGHKERKSNKKKEEQVLELIDSLNQSLRSGLSLQQSLEISLEDVGKEMRGEMLAVLKDLGLGSGLEEALSKAAHLSITPSIKLTFTVLGLLHGKGGDLPRILERLRKRVAEGLEVRREARILTSQSRASGYLVSSLPPVFLGLQAVLNPRSLQPLLSTSMGNLIITVAAGLNIAAFFLIRRIVSPEG